MTLLYNILNFKNCYCFLKKNIELDDIDTNEDGCISLQEFHNFFITHKKRGPTLEEWMKFHLNDTNNNGVLSKKEFEHVFL